MLEGDKQQSLADKDLKEELNNNNQSNKKPNKKLKFSYECIKIRINT